MLAQKARAEFHLKNYLISEYTVKKALKLNPINREGKRLLTQLQTILGVKTNLMIKDAIASLYKNQTTTTLKKLRSKYSSEIENTKETLLLRQQTQYHWKPKKKWKKSTQSIYYIPNVKSLSQLPELNFEVNSNHTKFYVNQFSIYDKNLKRIQKGKISNYYITHIHDNTIHPENLLVHLPIKVKDEALFIMVHVTEEALYSSKNHPFVHYNTKGLPHFIENSFEIKTPPKHLKHFTFGKTKVQKSKHSLTFTFKSNKALSNEKFSPGFQEFGAGFSVALENNWKAAGDEYIHYIEEQGVPLDSAPLAIIELLDDLKEKTTSTQSLSQLAYQYVRDEITYNNYEFNLQALVPEESRNVVSRKSSDCKGHALLLLHLLRAQNIDAHLALTHTDINGSKDLVSIHQFNHMIVYYLDPITKTEYFLDPTEKFQPFRRSPLSLEGRHVLVLEDNKSRLITIPEINSPNEHQVTINHQYHIQEDLTVEGKDSITLTGKLAADFRAQIKKWKKLGKLDVLVSWITAGYVGYWNGDLTILNDDVIDSALILVFQYKQPLPLNGFKKGMIFKSDLEKSIFRYPDAKGRQSPIYFPFSIELKSNWSIQIPSSLKLNHQVSSQTEAADFLIWKRNIQEAKGLLTLEQTWKLEPFLATPTEYITIKKDWDKIMNRRSFKLQISK